MLVCIIFTMDPKFFANTSFSVANWILILILVILIKVHKLVLSEHLKLWKY